MHGSGNESEPDEATDDKPESLPSRKKQLSSFALTKRIVECAGIGNPMFYSLMRNVQRFVRLQASQSATWTTLDVFFQLRTYFLVKCMQVMMNLDVRNPPISGTDSFHLPNSYYREMTI